jgi:hypothetical protein
VDSPLEGDGFEPSVPGARSSGRRCPTDRSWILGPRPGTAAPARLPPQEMDIKPVYGAAGNSGGMNGKATFARGRDPAGYSTHYFGSTTAPVQPARLVRRG